MSIETCQRGRLAKIDMRSNKMDALVDLDETSAAIAVCMDVGFKSSRTRKQKITNPDPSMSKSNRPLMRRPEGRCAG